jgi:hypothetical protein
MRPTAPRRAAPPAHQRRHVHADGIAERLHAGGEVHRARRYGEPVGDEPLVVVDDDPGVPRSEPVVVASWRDAPWADVVLTSDDDLSRVSATVAAHPDASIALVVLLRGSEERSVEEGLVAESTTYGLLQGGADHHRWLASRSPRRREPEGSEIVRLSRHGDVLHVTLDRPAVRNAYSAAMRDRLVEALEVAAADETLRVELRGEGPSFCSGGDLDEFGTTADPAVAHRIRLRRNAGRSLAALADRTTAFVHGACVGAGVELPAFAGRVVARSDATFLLPEVGMGLVPGAGGTVSIPRRIGRRRAALLALQGTPVDATTALGWGLVDEVVR